MGPAIIGPNCLRERGLIQTEWAEEILAKKDLTSPELSGTSFLADRVLDFFPLNLNETG
jgi:hypothetical protein